MFHAPVLESAISSSNLDSFYWRLVLETKIWVSVLLVATGVLLLLALSDDIARKCVYIRAFTDILLYICVSVNISFFF